MGTPPDNRSAEMREIRRLALSDHWLARYALSYALELLSAREMQWVLSATQSAERTIQAQPDRVQTLLRERFGE